MKTDAGCFASPDCTGWAICVLSVSARRDTIMARKVDHGSNQTDSMDTLDGWRSNGHVCLGPGFA